MAKNNSADSKANRPSGPRDVPYLLDFTFSISNLVVLLAGVSVTGVSFLHGASFLIAVLRGCVAMLAFGICAWWINFHISRNVIETVQRDVKRAVNYSQGVSEKDSRA